MTEIEYNSNDDIRNNALNLLDEVREPVWRKVIENCESFRLRNSDAQFSEIFSANLFKTLSRHEQEIFQIEVNSKGICSQCLIEKELKSTVLVNYISEVEYPELLSQENDWPKTFESLGNGSGICDNCYEPIPANIYSDINFPHYVFVEFGGRLVNKSHFFEQIQIKDCQYKLVALVRNSMAHFACAVLFNNTWNYFDDLKKNRLVFQTILDLMNISPFSMKPKRSFFVMMTILSIYFP